MTSGYVKPGDPITAYVRYVSAATGLGLAGIAVKVAVNRGASNLVSVASATAATEVDATNQPGLYSYTYSGDTTTLGQYIFAFTTTDLTVSARSWTVITEVGYIPANLEAVGGVTSVDGQSPLRAFRLMMAALLGKLSGAATTTIVIRASDDSKDRITATVDSDGNRSAVTLDGA